MIKQIVLEKKIILLLIVLLSNSCMFDSEKTKQTNDDRLPKRPWQGRPTLL